MVILEFERKLMKKTKNKIVKKKNKQVTAYQKALKKKLKLSVNFKRRLDSDLSSVSFSGLSSFSSAYIYIEFSTY